MLYLIGLGLDKDSISKEGKDALKKSENIYLENYTVDFPYTLEELKKNLGIKFILADRDKVEDLSLVQEAKKHNVALLVYGSPLTATTHISLIQEAKRENVEYEIIYNGSVFDAIAETGLEIYKFGKVTSIPLWKRSFQPTSFAEIIKQNQQIDAHSLILIDIGLELKDAINELKQACIDHELKLSKIVICSNLGTRKKKIFYKEIDKISDLEVEKPYCIIIPSELHFLEKEVLEEFGI